MGEIFFVIKGFVITALLTMALQIRIGQETLEVRAERWLQHSFAAQFVTDTAGGAVKALQRGYRWAQREVMGDSGMKLLDEKQLGPWKIKTKHPIPGNHQE